VDKLFQVFQPIDWRPDIDEVIGNGLDQGFVAMDVFPSQRPSQYPVHFAGDRPCVKRIAKISANERFGVIEFTLHTGTSSVFEHFVIWDNTPLWQWERLRDSAWNANRRCYVVGAWILD
jgi:hypothetical protein